MLIALLALPLALRAPTPLPQEPWKQPRVVVRDSAAPDSAPRNSGRRLPVTAAVIASAFRDAATRDLFERAKRTRLAQDSALDSYDAKVRQRMSVFMSVGSIGRERLVYRQESASRVRWQRDAGVRIEMTGGRVAIPVFGNATAEREALKGNIDDSEMSPIPYFPGSEALWIGGVSARAEVDDRRVINPLARGAEAYYTYRLGDSLSFRLPDGRTILLRELHVRPRKPDWNSVVGSLWFDVSTAQLVRAAYRLSTPTRMQVRVRGEDSSKVAPKVVSAIISGMLSPATAEISAMVVEYGLYGGRFWLPRLQTMEGRMQAMFARVPLRYENKIDYASVGGSLGMARVVVDTARFRNRMEDEPPDSLTPDERRKWRRERQAEFRAFRAAREDSVKKGMKVGIDRQCEQGENRVITEYRYRVQVPVEVTIPCDLEKLARSEDLPSSIYDPGEEIFGSTERDALISSALSMAAQAPLFGGFPAPRLQFGPSMTRYNRVEGLSTGLLVEQQIGAGYSVTGVGRYGFADRVGGYELSLARSNSRRTIRLNGYNRLVSAGDWGNPLSFGSGLSALMFGTDDGFYYRATGAELTWTTSRVAPITWRAFAERDRDAPRTTTYSWGGTLGPNIVATAGSYAGGSMRLLHTYGLDPAAFRVFTDLRLEGGAASGDSSYGRGALDLTLSRQLFRRVTGALTLSGGTSVGDLPSQRRWFLGGTHTVRGQSADTAQSGTAFWMGRAEFARQFVGVRTALFGDIGWTGDRTRLRDVQRPLTGAGIGISAFDGLIRLDVARGIHPRVQTRVNLYLDARF